MIKKLGIFLFALLIPSLAVADNFARGSGLNEGDLKMQKYSIQSREVDNTPICPPSDEIKLYAKDSAGTTKFYTLDSACSEVPVVTGTGYTASDAQSDTGWTKSGTTVKLTTLTDNVGIGSALPGQKLDITGTVRISTGLQVGTPYIQNGIITGVFSDSATAPDGANEISLYNSNGGINAVGCIDFLHKGSSATERPSALLCGAHSNNTTDASNMQFRLNSGLGNSATSEYMRLAESGNLGIGSTAPGQKLDIAGNTRITSTNTLNFGNDNKAFIGASANTTPDIKFSTNSAEVMRVTNGGNVGIGTSTPQGAFIVTNGNVGIGTWAPSVGFQANVPVASFIGTATLNLTNTNTMNVSNDFSILVNSSPKWRMLRANAFGIGTDLGLYGSSEGGYASIQADGSSAGLALGSVNNTRIVFTPNLVEKMRLTTAGNLGLGTVSPSSLFVVAGGGVGIGTNANSAFIQTAAPLGGLITEANVGVGTITPNARLSVVLNDNSSSTSLEMSNTASSTTSRITNIDLREAGTLVASYGHQSGSVFGNGNAGSYFASRVAGEPFMLLTGGTAAGNERMRVTGVGNIGIGTTIPQGAFVVTSGNVGIGTWVPNAPMEILSGTTGIMQTIYGSSAGAVYTQYQDVNSGRTANDGLTIGYNGGGIIFNRENSQINFGTNNTGRAIIAAGGNFGIGTLAPVASGSTPTALFQVVQSTTGDAFRVDDQDGGDTSPFIVDSAGNVGIGTVTPGVKLDVQGDIRGSTVSGQVDGTILCIKNGRIGYCSGVVAGVLCTCN